MPLFMDSLPVSYDMATARPILPLPCWEIQKSFPLFTTAKDVTATSRLPSMCMCDGPPRVDGEKTRMVNSKRHTCFTF